MAIVNIVFHITLPQGLALVNDNATPPTHNNGAYLTTPVTFDVVSSLMPYYASVEQVKLQGGLYLRRMSDLTVASMIYNASQQVDLLNVNPPILIANSGNVTRFYGSRNQYVQALAAKLLIENIIGLIGNPSSHTLANFTVTNQRPNLGEGVGQKIGSLQSMLTLYEPTIRSGGNTVPGGHPKVQFAAKGLFDWTERTPARTWMVTGMGANMVSPDWGSPTGGRGKPMRVFSSPFYSPPITNLRTGIYQGAYSLTMVYR